MKESERIENKAVYSANDKQRLELVKTVVAMANTKGGKIYYDKVECDSRWLDSSAVDDMVNRYVEPRVTGISSETFLDGSFVVEVQDSADKPHVFTHEVSFQDKRKTKSAFHPGQIWVRHSSKTEPATADDVRQLVHHAAGRLFERLSKHVRQPGFVMRLDLAEATSVRISNEKDAMPVVPDLEHGFPFTTKTLGQRLDQQTGWVAKAAEVLGLKHDRRYSLPVPGSGDYVAQWRYSEAAKTRIEKELGDNPDWNPYHVG